MSVYRITGFTGDTSWATEDAIADARTRLEKHAVDVVGFGRTSEAGKERIQTIFTLEADSDGTAEARAKEILLDVFGSGYGWGVSRVESFG